jgi:hypothetical protein
MGRMRAGLLGALVATGLLAVAPAAPGAAAPEGGGVDPVAAHWTAGRMRAAIPRDLVLDERGLAFRQGARGVLVPHGHAAGQLSAASAPKAKPTPSAKPGGGDRTPPSIGALDPASGATIGGSHTFEATVTDTSGVQSVSFRITLPSGTTQSFGAVSGANNVWSSTISGFSSGSGWSWQVVARDRAKPANTATSAPTPFTVDTGAGGGGGGGGDVVTNAAWTGGGTVQRAAGRIFFEMPSNSRLTKWVGYVCSGTVAEEPATGRSVIITAAHCVYDDVHKVFARNVLFIPDQDGTTGAGTDRDCSNDPIGCWTPTFGVVDRGWTTRVFPDNIPWDYAFYVVRDTGAHSGSAASSEALATAAGDLPVQLSPAPAAGATTHALGYSYSEDPSFMYCAEPLGTEPSYGDWWLSQCGLSGGSSGGPWLQPVDSGEGPIVSVNSWGYTNQPGMGGPRLHDTSAGCVFSRAQSQPFDAVSTSRGAVADC